VTLASWHDNVKKGALAAAKSLMKSLSYGKSQALGPTLGGFFEAVGLNSITLPHI
jgi:hypothetical protein